ncbi:MAG: biotin--[acetyl-CoA-carboxylase] ligase [Euryarchaeota archaeon]|nr:biotin--[acetyl-CoA-carboxylase] ligase [Euryarchaeota archaeon]
MFSKHLFKTYLKTNILGQKIIYKNKTSSTNTDAKEYLYNKNFHGSIFVSDSQYNGRGRRGSSWESTPDKSLTFSLLLHPEIKLKNIGLIPLVIGIGIVKGILISTSISAGLKWPNDIFLNNKKIGGILIETKQINNYISLVIGIGLNINQQINDISENIIKKTTSLSIHASKTFSRELILANILDEFEILFNSNLNSIIDIWESYCIHQNKNVTFHSKEEIHTGTFKGISENGYAKIEIDNNLKKFPSGMIIL